MAMKKGGGVVEGLFTGTAFFAASNSKSFLGFVTTFLLYSAILLVGFMAVAYIMRAVSGKEMFSVAEIKCPAGSSPGICPGRSTQGCITPNGNCTASLTQ